MLSLAIFGGNHIDGGMLEPGERIVSVVLFGGIDFDFASVPPPPALEVVVIAMFGGASFKLQAQQPVRLTGVDIFGGRSVEPMRGLPSSAASASPPAEDGGDLDLPLEITAYSLFGGVSVKRVDGTLPSAARVTA
jgi:hypothetical protein